MLTQQDSCCDWTMQAQQDRKDTEGQGLGLVKKRAQRRLRKGVLGSSQNFLIPVVAYQNPPVNSNIQRPGSISNLLKKACRHLVPSQ